MATDALNILQIGDTILHISNQKLLYDYPVETRGRISEAFNAPLLVSPDSQWILRERNIKAVGVLVNTPHIYVEELVGTLNYYVGKPTPIIAYHIPDMHPSKCCCQCRGTECGGVSGCPKGCTIDFLQSIGVLKRVHVTRSDPHDPSEIEIELDVLDFWRELDNYMWEWISGLPLPFNGTTDPYTDGQVYGTYRNNNIDYFVEFPGCAQILGKCDYCNHFDYRKFDDFWFAYDDLWWLEKYQPYCDNSKHGLSDYRVPINQAGKTFDTGRGIWNAPPQSIYSIQEMPNTGVIDIGIEGWDGHSRKKVTTHIDLDQLNQDLIDFGIGGLTVDDRLVFGDIRRYVNGESYRPAYIERSGVVVPNFYPVIDYPEFWPGMVSPGWTRFKFQPGGGGDFTNTTVSYIHNFRRI